MLWMAETHDLDTVKILHAKDMLHHAKYVSNIGFITKKAAMDNKEQSTKLFQMNAAIQDYVNGFL